MAIGIKCWKQIATANVDESNTKNTKKRIHFPRGKVIKKINPVLPLFYQWGKWLGPVLIQFTQNITLNNVGLQVTVP